MKQRATVVCRRAGEILLVTRLCTRWSLPGGRVRRAESLVDAAGRELEEETSLVAERLTWLFQFGGANTLHHVFVADLRDGASPRAANEIARCQWFRTEKIARLPVSVSTRGIVQLVSHPDHGVSSSTRQGRPRASGGATRSGGWIEKAFDLGSIVKG